MTSQCRTYPAFKSLIHCSRPKIATFLQKTYLNRLIVINISQFQFKFRLKNCLSLVLSMIIQCWFGLRLCSEQASHCLNQRWLNLLTPICVSRPECIKAIMKIVFTNYILRFKQHNLHKINTLNTFHFKMSLQTFAYNIQCKSLTKQHVQVTVCCGNIHHHVVHIWGQLVQYCIKRVRFVQHFNRLYIIVTPTLTY